jgi:hypothetical protein
MQTLYLNSDQTNELVTTIGANAVVIFTHYIAIAHQTNPNMEDTQLAKLTGLAVHTVKRTRIALTKAGWFLKIKSTYKGEKQVTYLVGKDVVNNRSSIAVLSKSKPE